MEAMRPLSHPPGAAAGSRGTGSRYYLDLRGSEAVMAVWGLRVMTELGGYRKTLGGKRLVQLEDFEWCGLGLRPFREGVEPYKFLRLARGRLARLEADRPSHDEPFATNIRLLAEDLRLDHVARVLLELTATVKTSYFMDQMLQHLPRDLGHQQVFPRTLARILGVDQRQVRAALSPAGRLFSTGLLSLNDSVSLDLSDRLDLLDGLSERLFAPHADSTGLLEPFLPRARGTDLALEDFPHLADEIRWAIATLKHALATARRGVNILIYGPPGTGKTELASVIGRACDAALCDVGAKDPRGCGTSGRERYRLYQLAQGFLAGLKDRIVIFDEVEDVFKDEGQPAVVFGSSIINKSKSKAWVNDLLETNPVPAIWIANDVDVMEDAFIRRFSCVIEAGIPPLPVRKKLLEGAIGKLSPSGIDDDWIEAVAAHPNLSPAVIQQAAQGAAHCQSAGETVTAKRLERAFSGWFRAMGLPPVRPPSRGPRLPYRPDLLNTTPPVAEVVAGLKKVGFGRLCLHGPPGTGKTAFAKHLARELGRPLIAKRASDLLSPWVGVTEHNLAEMFREAEDAGAVLLLDEADSFLRSRASARATWEITQVNELLTQMESFEGVFLCATNFLEALDQASLRRFDIKIKFDALTPDQRWELFRQLFALAGKDKCISEEELVQWESRVKADLNGITFGDIAVVARRVKPTRNGGDPKELFTLLKKENSFKRNGIGFTAEI